MEKVYAVLLSTRWWNAHDDDCDGEDLELLDIFSSIESAKAFVEGLGSLLWNSPDLKAKSWSSDGLRLTINVGDPAYNDDRARYFFEIVEKQVSTPFDRIHLSEKEDTMEVKKPVTGRIFSSTEDKIKEAESMLNKTLIDTNMANINDFYAQLEESMEENIRKEAEIERDSWGWKFDGSWIFSSKDEAMEVATGMHKMLQDIVDYVEDRIILTVDGYTVSLTVYDDATTELEIEDISKHPRITRVKFDAPPEVIASFVGGGR